MSHSDSNKNSHLFAALYQLFSKIVIRNIPLTEVKQFSKFDFGGICSQRLTTSPLVSIDYTERDIVDNKNNF